MDLQEDFSRRIEAIQQQLAHLTLEYHSSQAQNPDLVEQALDELSTALEELHVADEELRAQSEQLAQATLEAARAEARYQHLFEYAPDGYLVTDQHGIIQKANRAAVHLFSRPIDYLIGKPLVILFIEADHPKIYSFLNKIKMDQSLGFETKIQQRKGAVVDVSIQVDFPEGLVDEIPGVYWLIREITEQKQLESDLRAGKVELENSKAAHARVEHLLIDQLEKERRQISRDLHDGPLQGILAVTFELQVAIEEANSPKEAEALKTILQNIQNHTRMLRNFSLNLRPPILFGFGLAKAIQSYLEEFREKYLAIDVQMEVVQDDALVPEPIMINLYRIFQETMINVARHAEATQIRARYEKNGQFIELIVQDNGHGFIIPADWDELAREGHLGMVGMIERAQAVNGQIEVDSKPGNGTLVRVHVPINTI